MLHAVNSNKARLNKIIDDVGKQPREDLITSALFGAIEFLSSHERIQALEALTGMSGFNEPEIHFWPAFYPTAGNSWVEPDIVIAESAGSEIKCWIVEVKWGAGLGLNQISREIDALRNSNPSRAEGVQLWSKPLRIMKYLLLGYEPGKHENDVEKGKQRNPDINITTMAWPDVTEALQCLADEMENAGNGSGLHKWADTAATFLSGTVKGSRLGAWPSTIRSVPVCSFHFSRSFAMPPTIVAVGAARFLFNKR